MEYIYAALLLHKLGKPVDEAHLKKVVAATGVEVNESKVKSLIASLHGVDITSELANANMAATAATHGVGSGEVKQEKKAEKKEEGPSESAAGLSALFG